MKLLRAAWLRANPDYHKRWEAENRGPFSAAKIRQLERWYQRKYGVGLEDVLRLANQQDWACAICGRKFEDVPYRSASVRRKRARHFFHVDHDHVTEMVRGLLCYNCNSLLGQARDDPKVLKSAADYLEHAAKNHRGPDPSEDRRAEGERERDRGLDMEQRVPGARSMVLQEQLDGASGLHAVP